VRAPGEHPDRFTAAHPRTRRDGRVDRFEGAAQPVVVLDHHDGSVHHDRREGDGPRPGRAHDRARWRGQVDAAVTGEPGPVRRVERPAHLGWLADGGGPRVRGDRRRPPARRGVAVEQEQAGRRRAEREQHQGAEQHERARHHDRARRPGRCPVRGRAAGAA
jgi:hypothetical protein